MIEQFAMWQMYFANLIHNPVNMYVFVISLTFSAVLYYFFKNEDDVKRKVAFLTAHILLLFFPFIFAALAWPCVMPALSCSPMLFVLILPAAGVGALLLSFGILPFIYSWANRNDVIQKGRVKAFVQKHSDKLRIKPPSVYYTNEVMPQAYSITNLKPAIFITASLSEMLTKKEMEAVILHELHHHKSKAYFWKFSFNTLKMLTPLSTFFVPSSQMEKEEMEADMNSVFVQKTDRHLKSAKEKIRKFGKQL